MVSKTNVLLCRIGLDNDVDMLQYLDYYFLKQVPVKL